MKIKTFFSIGKNAYIPCEEVKAIIDSKAKIAYTLINKSKQLNLEIINVVSKNDKRLSIIWMIDGKLYLSSNTADTLAKRFEKEDNTKMINVGSGLYVSINHINGVFAFESTLATKLRNTEENSESSNISFVRKNQHRKSTITLKTGEKINVSSSPKKVIKDIGKAD